MFEDLRPEELSHAAAHARPASAAAGRSSSPSGQESSLFFSGRPRTANKFDFVISGPAWDRGSQDLYILRRSELKMCTLGKRDTDIGFQLDDFFARGLFAPQFSTTGENEPNLFDGPVRHRARDFAGEQFKMRHGAASQTQQ